MLEISNSMVTLKKFLWYKRKWNYDKFNNHKFYRAQDNYMVHGVNGVDSSQHGLPSQFSYDFTKTNEGSLMPIPESNELAKNIIYNPRDLTFSFSLLHNL
jgi:hypothetical protein